MDNITNRLLENKTLLIENEQESKNTVDQESGISVEDLKALLDSKKDTLKSLEPSKLKKLYSFIDNIGKGYTGTLRKKLQEKKLNKDQIQIVTYIASMADQEASFIRAIEDTSNTFRNTVGEKGDNLIGVISNKTQIPVNVVEELFNITAGKGQRTVGKGEILLKTLLHDTSDPVKLDLKTKDEVLELKVAGAVISPLTSNSKSAMIYKLNQVFGGETEKDQPWLALLESKLREVEDPEEKLKNFVDITYEGYVEIGSETTRLIGKESIIDSLKLEITYQLVESYLKKEGIEKIMFISNTGKNYTILPVGSIDKETVSRNFIIQSLSDRNPRISYKFE